MSTWVVVVDGFLTWSPLWLIAAFLLREGWLITQEREQLLGASDAERPTLPRQLEESRWKRAKGYIALQVIFTLAVLVARIMLRS